jgi:hypothetical protein
MSVAVVERLQTFEDTLEHAPPPHSKSIFYLGRVIGFVQETPLEIFERDVEAQVDAYTGRPDIQASILTEAALEREFLDV